jgi:HEAT repeat protein
MKRIIVISTVISVLFTANLFSKNLIKPKNSAQTKITVENLLRGVSSENSGLRLSCAYYLGELKSEKALIPLMKMLRSDKKECNRIMAALSLFKLQSERAVFMIKREATFNNSKRVREMCKIFYEAYLMNVRTKTFSEKSKPQTIAQSLR